MFFISSYEFSIGLFSFLFIVHVSCGEIEKYDSLDGGETRVDGVIHRVNLLNEYIRSLRQSQDEVFRKIDWFTKIIEDKNREDHKFRVKFNRKVHNLENKLHILEQTFAQKVEEIVERKLNEKRFHYIPDSDDETPISDTDQSDQLQIQSHQPSYPSSLPHNARYQHAQQPYTPYNNHHLRHEPSYQNNWGFYEHPITNKKVRDGTLYKYEPPTRDLPLISLVATTSTNEPTTTTQVLKHPLKSPVAPVITVKEPQVTSEFVQESRNRFDKLEVALKGLRENVSNLEQELSKGISGVRGGHGNKDEVHHILVENSKDIINLNQKHQEMLRRIEHFTVEMEKAAAKREHTVNESIKEISADLKKQIGSVKTYVKRQIQNITTSSTGDSNSSVPDRTKCAQTLVDEIMAQMNKQKSRYPSFPSSSFVQTDLIADQADTEDGNELGKLTLFTGRSMESPEATVNVTRELEIQRKEILELKSEIAKLNISQILLMRTVDEETLKRTVRPRDCSEIRLLRNVSSGVFSIFPWMNDVSIDVYCDMKTDGGGWTVIQRRGELLSNDSDDDERESFVRGWNDYEGGFGSLDNDFWLGLENIAALCHLGIQELRIDMTNWLGESRYASYQYFKISNASDKYRISVSSYKGTAGDSLSRHDGMAFSTPDMDNDADPRRHCAKTYFSGWWYYACFESNLNGIYVDEKEKSGMKAFGTGIIWQHWMGHYNSLKRVEMKIRNTFIGESHYLKRIL